MLANSLLFTGLLVGLICLFGSYTNKGEDKLIIALTPIYLLLGAAVARYLGF